MIFGKKSKPVTQFNSFTVWNTYIKMIQHELWSIVPRYDTAVGVVRGPVPHMDIHLFAFSGFVHSSNMRTYCLSFTLRDSSPFMKDAMPYLARYAVLFSPQVNDFANSESGNIAAKTLLMPSFDLKGIMSAHRVENPQYLRLLGFWWRHKAG